MTALKFPSPRNTRLIVDENAHLQEVTPEQTHSAKGVQGIFLSRYRPFSGEVSPLQKR